MYDFITEFEWPRAKAYEAVRWNLSDARARGTILGSAMGGWMLVPRGEPKVCRPSGILIDKSIAALLTVAEGDVEDPEVRRKICMVAQSLGMLSGNSQGDNHEALSMWTDFAGQLKQIHQLSARNSWGVDDLLFVGVGLRRRGHRTYFSFKPRTLAAALKVRVAQSLVKGATLRTCLKCGTPFTAGGGSHKRSNSKFCTPICKSAFHNAEAKR